MPASQRPEANEDIADGVLERQTPTTQIPQATPHSLPRPAGDVMNLLKQVGPLGAIPAIIHEQRNHARPVRNTPKCSGVGAGTRVA